MKVLAAQLVAPGRMELIERELPDRLGDESVRVRMQQVAFCGSDADRARRQDPKMPTNPTGHESVGIVEAVGRDVKKRFQIGQRVVAWTPDGYQMAAYYDAKARYCVPISAEVEFAAAAEPLGCVWNSTYGILNVGDDVAIIGASGFMGNMLVQVCRLGGARRIIATSRSEKGRGRALSAGATHAVHPDELESAVRELTRGVGVDVAYELTSKDVGITLAGRVAHAGTNDTDPGIVAIVGYHQHREPPTEWGAWNGKGLRVFNCHFRPEWECIRGIRRAVRLLETGAVNPGPHIDFPLEQADTALRHAVENPGEKAVIVF